MYCNTILYCDLEEGVRLYCNMKECIAIGGLKEELYCKTTRGYWKCVAIQFLYCDQQYPWTVPVNSTSEQYVDRSNVNSNFDFFLKKIK